MIQSILTQSLRSFVSRTICAAVASGVMATGCSVQQFSQAPLVQSLGQRVTYNNQVDVLFVVDTKDGMAPVQKGLADQMPEFLNALNRTGLDYQIAVTTMDMSANGEKGRFIGSPAVLTPRTPGLSATLAERLYVGVYDWKPMSRAFEAVKNGLSSAELAATNAGFLRDNALLVMIFLSNRDDRSTPIDYKAFFDQVRPALPYGDRSWVAQFMGVLPDDPNCKTAAWGYSEPGMAFIDLAKSSGGSYESICDGDMRRALTNVKARVLEKITAYPLQKKPALESIKVSINGRSIPNDALNGWTYHPENNTIRFHGASIPNVGDTVLVDFYEVSL